MPRAAARKSLPKIPADLWNDLSREFPRGMCWRYDGVGCVRKIIRELQSFLSAQGVPLIVTLDEGDHSEAEPANVIVLHGERTKLVSLRFRKRLVYVAGLPVAVAHDDGAAMLARAIVREIENVLRLNRTSA